MILLPLTDSLVNAVEIICQDHFYAHIQESFSFLRIIGPEYIQSNVMSLRLVDHLLIKVGLEQLNLIAAHFNGPVHDLHGRIASAHTSQNTGILLPYLPKQMIIAAHDIAVLHAVILLDEFHDLIQQRFVIGMIVVASLDMYIHNGVAGELFEDLFKFQDLQALIGFGVSDAEIHLKQFFICVLPHISRTGGHAVQCRVVNGYELSILGRPKIELYLLCPIATAAP